MISHQRGAIFTAIPKTGSSSICKALQVENFCLHHECRSDHMHVKGLRQKNIFLEHWNDYDSYFKFTFVRDPWDRCLSAYKWYSTPSGRRALGNKGELYDTRVVSFSKFIRDYVTIPAMSAPREGYFQKMDLQVNWILDSSGKTIPDFVGRFENLQHDFDIVCDKIGVPRKKLPHLNKTDHKHYTECYDEETKQIVAELYAKDIEFFGYEFGACS